MQKKASTKGLEAFTAYFERIYGDRWSTLLLALKQPNQPVAYNPFHLSAPYFLDVASIEAARALPIKAGDHVLDMCAAPGGKALVLAEKLAGTGSLVLNERSAARRLRLKHVVENHLPEAIQKTITIKGHDAALFGMHKPNEYDAVLLDAPCSSERHLLEKPDLMKDWSPKRSAFLAQRQYAMLASAFLTVKPGRHILYATCSISPLENDDVVRRLLKKKQGEVSSIPVQAKLGEATDLGWRVLPDRGKGAGPLYFALLVRGKWP